MSFNMEAVKHRLSMRQPPISEVEFRVYLEAAIDEIESLRKRIHKHKMIFLEIEETADPIRNPDGVDQYPEEIRLIAREAREQL